MEIVKGASSRNNVPTAENRTYDGSGRPLVSAGSVDGGTLYYALGSNSTIAPTDGWSTDIPSASIAGTYYVWYKVQGDANHNDVAPACITVTIGEATTPTDVPAPTVVSTPATPATPAIPSTPTESITISKTPASVKAKAAKKGKVTVSWKKIKKTKKTKALLAQIKGIEVQYSTDPGFTTDVATKPVGKNKTKVTLKLQKNTTYYVRVRYTDGAGGVSNWSAVKRVKTKK